ncbi:MAG TPA: sugar phosphate isomerase/epimerase [Bryobacteraceae bacterium]|nr:sugar phosphate isomerase/epimerase [Bryobacteraceae bacterium]
MKSRRTFLTQLTRSAAVAGLLQVVGRGNPRRFDRPVGLELYSVRRELPGHVPEVLKQVRALGYEQVETGPMKDYSPESFRHELDSAGLTCPSFALGVDEIRTGNYEETFRWARAVGATDLMLSWLEHKSPFTYEQAVGAAAKLNDIGRKVHDAGYEFLWHPHGWEFQPWNNRKLIDYLFEKTDPKLVSFEMDVFWFVHAGGDPVTFLRRYPGRVRALHLKDLVKGGPVNIPDADVPEKDSVVLGTGMIDFPGILREAVRQNVRYYFVEDENENAIEQIGPDIRYLKQVEI